MPRRVVQPGIIKLPVEADQRYQLAQRERITFALIAQTDRLRALILEDLERFPDSGCADIHHRIGSEIHEKALSRALDVILAEGAVVSTGERRWRK